MAEKPVPPKSDSLIRAAPIAKKWSIGKVLNISVEFSVDIPLWDDGFIDVLNILKVAIRDFDQDTIALGSSCSYKSLNYIYINFSGGR